MAEDDMCALFLKLRVEGVTCGDELKKHMKNAADEWKPLIERGSESESMDIDEEGGSVDNGLLYLYVDCPTMMQCFYGEFLPYNWRKGTLLTNLPPYQDDVTCSEVSAGLRRASGFGYEDPICSAYFTAFSFSGRVTKLDQQMEVISKTSESLKFDLYSQYGIITHRPPTQCPAEHLAAPFPATSFLDFEALEVEFFIWDDSDKIIHV